ncbi:unnamed protein product, partial [Ectocarpus sp. 8 AP-2014]
ILAQTVDRSAGIRVTWARARTPTTAMSVFPMVTQATGMEAVHADTLSLAHK